MEVQFFRLGSITFLLGDLSVPHHTIQHISPPFLVVLRVGVWIIERRVIGDTDQAGAFSQGKLGHILTKIHIRCGCYSVALPAKTNDIEVLLQNLLLGISFIYIQRGEYLKDLPFYGHLITLRGVFDHLLRNGRTTADLAPGEKVKNTFCRTEPVYAVMLVETPVLDRYRRVDQIFGDIIIFYIDPILISAQRFVFQNFPALRVGIIDRTGKGHRKIRHIKADLGNDHLLDIDRREASQKGAGDNADQQQRRDSFENASDDPLGFFTLPPRRGCVRRSGRVLFRHVSTSRVKQPPIDRQPFV